MRCPVASDPVISVTASFVVAYGVYIAAEGLHVSGVLAVVAAGLYFAWWAPSVLSADVRLSGSASPGARGPPTACRQARAT